MKDGTLVVFKTGKIVYKAYRANSNDWRHRYNLIPENGVGRNRYQVNYDDIRAYVPSDVAPASTSKGRVKRPKNFRSLPEYSGSTRHTYVGKKWVYKLERRGAYIREGRNAIEAARYALQSGMPEAIVTAKFGYDTVREAHYFDDVPIAECYLLEDGILMMERVRPVYDLNRDESGQELTWEERKKLGYREPRWAGKVDCNQIGYTAAGKLVAYDL
jgi:hypothetical protein